MFSDDWPRGPGCSSASSRGSSSSPARPAGRGRARAQHPGPGRAVPGDARGSPWHRGSRSAFFVKRVWLFVPIFTGIVVLPRPSASSPPATSSCPSARGSVTRRPHQQGLTAAGLIVTRVAVVDLARRAADAHDAVEPAARGAARAVRPADVRPRSRRWRTATSSSCSTRSPTCTPPEGPHGRRRHRHDLGTRRSSPRRPARCSARRTRSSEEVHMAMVSRGLHR